MTGQLDAATYAAIARDLAASWSLEEILSEPLAFGLELSPVQRAVARVAVGAPLGELVSDEAVIRSLGGADATQEADGLRPRELGIISGIRTGKSLIAGGIGVHATQHVDVTRLGPGEVPRVAIVSLTRDIGRVVFAHILGRVQSSPVLRHLLIGEPTSNTITLRHPSGRPVEIVVSAGARAGGSLVGRWLAAVVFDEAARMIEGSDEGVINWEESRRAVLERILPGGLIAHVTAPWAPFGPAYTLAQEHGAPTGRRIVFRCPAWDFYPSYWTPARVDEARTSESFTTDVEGGFATAEESLLSTASVEAALRDDADPEPAKAGQSYVGAIDPATRGNAWTLIVMTRTGESRRVVLAREWIGSPGAPLSPAAVLAEMAPLLRPYRVSRLDSDQWSADALNDLARVEGLAIDAVHLTERQRLEHYLRLRNALDGRHLSIPRVAHIREDLTRVRKRVTRTGVSIDLPVVSDGRHCDYAPALVLTLARYIPDAVVAPNVVRDPESVAAREAARRRFGRRADADFD